MDLTHWQTLDCLPYPSAYTCSVLLKHLPKKGDFLKPKTVPKTQVLVQVLQDQDAFSTETSRQTTCTLFGHAVLYMHIILPNIALGASPPRAFAAVYLCLKRERSGGGWSLPHDLGRFATESLMSGAHTLSVNGIYLSRSAKSSSRYTYL